MSNISRRKLAKGTAWTAPVALATTTLPAYAASTCTFTGFNILGGGLASNRTCTDQALADAEAPYVLKSVVSSRLTKAGSRMIYMSLSDSSQAVDSLRFYFWLPKSSPVDIKPIGASIIGEDGTNIAVNGNSLINLENYPTTVVDEMKSYTEYWSLPVEVSNATVNAVNSTIINRAIRVYQNSSTLPAGTVANRSEYGTDFSDETKWQAYMTEYTGPYTYDATANRIYPVYSMAFNVFLVKRLLWIFGGTVNRKCRLGSCGDFPYNFR